MRLSAGLLDDSLTVEHGQRGFGSLLGSRNVRSSAGLLDDSLTVEHGQRGFGSLVARTAVQVLPA
jgi:hypothetical protein